MTAPDRPRSPRDVDGARRRERLREAQLYLIATWPSGEAVDSAGGRGWLARVAAAVTGGARAVQLRVKDPPGPVGARPDAEVTALRRRLLSRLRATLPAHVLLIVNDDLHAVLDADGTPLADGVHLGREDARALLRVAGDTTRPPDASRAAGLARDGEADAVTDAARTAQGLAHARARLGPALLLGTSTRTRDEVAAASAAGCDHAGFGALASTTTRTGAILADPAELARVLAAHPGFPIFAIGGLGPDTLHLVTEAGGRRAAIGSAILDARDPAAAARACLAALASSPLRR